MIVTPSFTAALVAQTVSLGHSKSYPLPSTTIPTPVISILTITPAVSWITLTGSSITMNPTYTDLAGTFSVTIQLTLGTITVEFPFNVISSNTPPLFATAPVN